MSENLMEKLEVKDITPETAESLEKIFSPYFKKAQEWKEKADGIVVNDVNDLETMQKAKSIRLSLKQLRVDVEKHRKSMKEESLRKGKAIDGMANIVKFLITPIEEHLENQEKFAERKLEEEKDRINDERIESLTPYVEDIAVFQLREMTEAGFEKLLETSKIAYNSQKDAEKKAEEERVAKEESEKAEQERIRLENEELKIEKEELEKKQAQDKINRERVDAELKKKESERIKKEQEEKDEREKMLKIEREAREEKEAKDIKEYEAKIQAEKEAKEKLELELKEKADAEQKAKDDAEAKELAEIEAQKQKELSEKQAPDKDKLIKLANLIDTIEMPILADENMKKIVVESKNLLTKVSNYIRSNIG